MLINDLEAVATARYPQIGKVKVILQGLGAWGMAMSGSGGAVFALFPSAEEASSGALGEFQGCLRPVLLRLEWPRKHPRDVTLRALLMFVKRRI